MRTKTRNILTAWAERINIRPEEAFELHRLANRAFAAEDQYKTDEIVYATYRRFENFAKSLGFDTRWPGLWPVLVRNGDEIHLPD